MPVQLNGLLEQQEKDRRERREKMVSGADLIGALRQERRELESKCTSASDRLKKVREETAFLWVSLTLGRVFLSDVTIRYCMPFFFQSPLLYSFEAHI